MGTPPQVMSRKIDEYGLINTEWHPEVPAVSRAPIPGTMEQVMACTWRSRCATKS